MDAEQAEVLIEKAKEAAERAKSGIPVVDRELLENSSAAPVAVANEPRREEDSRITERVQIFMELSGVGKLRHALAEGGYGTIGDILADTAEEVALKTGLSIGVARTVQMAADRYLQSE